MGGLTSDALFLDPTWRDPDMAGAGPSRDSLFQSGKPAVAAKPPSSPQSTAEDPFAQLSLSRGPSGKALHVPCILFNLHA